LTDIEVDLICIGADGERDVRVRTAPEWVGRCPRCSVVSTRSKGWVVTRPKDVKVGPDIPNLLWCKQKWVCRNTGCERKQFTGSVPQIPPRARFTGRARQEMAAAVLDRWRSVAEVADAYGTTWNTCHRAVVAMADPVLALAVEPVRVLGIDETRRGKAKWEVDPDTGKRRWVDRFDTGLVDITGDQGLLAQVNGRDAATVVNWLEQQSTQWRAGITHVAIDLSTTYAKAVRQALPHAIVVVDRFHVVKLANEMIDDVRRRTTQTLRGRRGRKCDPEWVSRRRMLRGVERLTDEQRLKMFDRLETFDRDGDLVAAWITKELLRKMLHCKDTDALRYEMRRRSTSSTPSPRPARSRRSARWPPPWTRGSGRSSPPSKPGCPTPAAKASTGSSNTSAVSPSGFATRPTNDAGYDGPAPATPGRCHPGSGRYAPVNSEEPASSINQIQTAAGFPAQAGPMWSDAPWPEYAAPARPRRNKRSPLLLADVRWPTSGACSSRCDPRV